MSKIVILIAGHLCTAPRPQKEAETLAAAGHDVIVRGFWYDPALVERDRLLMKTFGCRFVSTVDFQSRSLLGRMRGLNLRGRSRLARETFQRGYFTPSALGYGVRESLRAAIKEQADLTIVHSETGLWVGCELLKRQMRVGVDFEDWFSEDLLPQDRLGRPVKKIRSYERELLGRCDYRVTTSHALADALAETYAVPMPDVVYNAFPFADRAKIDGEMRDHSDRQIPSLHWFSQTIGEGRGLEVLFRSLRSISIPLEIHLRGNCSEYARRWVNGLVPEPWSRKVFIHPTVPNQELLSRIAEHDIGLALETPEIESRNLTVTNKLFQYLQAGLAVIATNTAGQREVFARRPQIGSLIPADDPRALATAIEELLKDPAKLKAGKAGAVKAAEEEFCWEKQEHRLLTAAEAALRSEIPKPESANLRFAAAS